MRHNGLQAAASRHWLAGPQPPAACSSSSRRQHSRLRAAAAPADAAALADLIQWPEGTRPKRGGVTKASLSRLKLADLRAELSRLGAADTSGTKEQLAEKLLEAIRAQAAAAPAAPAAPAAGGTSGASVQTDAAPAATADEQPLAAAQLQAMAGTAAAAAAAAAPATTAAAPRQRVINSSRQRLAEGPQNIEQQQQQQQQQQGAAAAALPRRRSSSSLASSSSSSSSNINSDGEDAASLNLAARLLLQKRGEAVQLGQVPSLSLDEARHVAAAVGVDLESLPPLTQRSRGHVYDVDALPGLEEEDREMVLKAIRSGLALTLLGGSIGDAAAGECAPSCLGLVRDKDIWLFDVGEDVQRSLIRREHLKPSKMHRVVITRQAPDAMLGLPGVLCIIGSSREKGHETADIPVHVFAPPGTGEFLSTLYECSNTFLEMPVVVHEFVLHAVGEEEVQPQPLNMRAKLWRALMPPDQLNPMGFIDGDIQAFMPTQGRARFKKGLRASGGVLATNPRAGHRPMATPPPGDPSRTDLNPADMTWTVVADEAATMTAVLLDADAPSWGIVWGEAHRQGNLSLPRCQALGINDPALYRNLKNGEPVLNEAGIMIPAPMVCSQDKPGRRVVLLPACSSADNIAPHAANADVMVAAAGAAAARGGGQMGAGLGICAQQWGVRNLLVTGMPSSAAGSSSSVWPRQRSSSSSSSSCGDGTRPGKDSQEEQQQKQEQGPEQALDPAAAAVLSVIAEQYTRGVIIPARDGMSVIVEENLGELDPPPLDLEEKAASARVTSLQGDRKAETTNEKTLQRRARRLEHREQAKQLDVEPAPQQPPTQQQQGWQQRQQQQDWQHLRADGQAGQQQQGRPEVRHGHRQQQPHRQQQQQQHLRRQVARSAAGSQAARR